MASLLIFLVMLVLMFGLLVFVLHPAHLRMKYIFRVPGLLEKIREGYREYYRQRKSRPSRPAL